MKLKIQFSQPVTTGSKREERLKAHRTSEPYRPGPSPCGALRKQLPLTAYCLSGTPAALPVKNHPSNAAPNCGTTPYFFISHCRGVSYCLMANDLERDFPYGMT